MLNERFTFKGTFRKGPGQRVFLRLAVGGANGSELTTLQLCDGTTLWDYRKASTEWSSRRLSIKPILKRLASPDLDRQDQELIISEIGFAGPETLLIELRKLFKFDTLDEDSGHRRRQIGLGVHGTWKRGPGLQELDPPAPSRREFFTILYSP